MRNPIPAQERPVATAGKVEQSPLERAKQIMSGMVRSEKEQRWLGMRMENFQRAFERRLESVSTKDVCDYLESLMRREQADWQVKQSLDAIGLLMRYGYGRGDMGVPDLREAWGRRLNERVGISVSETNTQIGKPSGSVVDRIRRVLRVAHYALKTEKAYTQARQLPHAATQLRDASVGVELRHPHCSGIARPQRRFHDDDLHACDESAGNGGAQSSGCCAGVSDVTSLARAA